jgi:hypothetical protein
MGRVVDEALLRVLCTVQTFQQPVDRVGEIPQLVAGSVEGEPLVDVAGGDPLDGGVHRRSGRNILPATSQPSTNEMTDVRLARGRPGDGVQARRSRPSPVACGERAPPRHPRTRRSPLRQRPPGRTTRRIRRRGSSSVTRNPQVLTISLEWFRCLGVRAGCLPGSCCCRVVFRDSGEQVRTVERVSSGGLDFGCHRGVEGTMRPAMTGRDCVASASASRPSNCSWSRLSAVVIGQS